jgi:NADH:ubiquinone oxidoreductase subunit 4 (subunit M)
MEAILGNKVYDVLKYVAQVALPAVATFYAGLGSLWGFPKVTEVVGTITLTDTLLGGLLLLSAAQYNNRTALYKGGDPAANQ